MIYFVTYENLPAYVKIGYSIDIDTRLDAYITYNPSPLVVYRVMEGDEGVERQMHQRFKHLRTNGEWFYNTAELQQFITDGTTINEEDKPLPLHMHQKKPHHQYSFLRNIPTELRKFAKDKKCWYVPLGHDYKLALQLHAKEQERTERWLVKHRELMRKHFK